MDEASLTVWATRTQRRCDCHSADPRTHRHFVDRLPETTAGLQLFLRTVSSDQMWDAVRRHGRSLRTSTRATHDRTRLHRRFWLRSTRVGESRRRCARSMTSRREVKRGFVLVFVAIISQVSRPTFASCRSRMVETRRRPRRATSYARLDRRTQSRPGHARGRERPDIIRTRKSIRPAFRDRAMVRHSSHLTPNVRFALSDVWRISIRRREITSTHEV